MGAIILILLRGHLKTDSMNEPELRAVEIPRERERRPLICSATTWGALVRSFCVFLLIIIGLFG